MSDSERNLVNLPTSVVLRRLNREDAEILKRAANTPLDAFIQNSERQGDWVISEQPVRTLPRAMTDLISLSLRDFDLHLGAVSHRAILPGRRPLTLQNPVHRYLSAIARCQCTGAPE